MLELEAQSSSVSACWRHWTEPLIYICVFWNILMAFADKWYNQLCGGLLQKFVPVFWHSGATLHLLAYMCVGVLYLYVSWLCGHIKYTVTPRAVRSAETKILHCLQVNKLNSTILIFSHESHFARTVPFSTLVKHVHILTTATNS